MVQEETKDEKYTSEQQQDAEENKENKTSLPRNINLSLDLTYRKPILSLAPPGQCQFTDEWTSVPLLDRMAMSGGTSYVLRFGTPDESKPLGLTTCACVVACAKLEGEEVVRYYTPISTNNQVGSFDLLIKNEHGKMTEYLCTTMKRGETIKFKRADFANNAKIMAPYPYKFIGMIAGGAGIACMIQALQAIIGEDGINVNKDDTNLKSATERVTLLYGSKVKEDILGYEMLNSWSAFRPDLFDLVHVLSDEPDGTEWEGERGFITKELIKRKLPPASLGSDVLILVCGPPKMYDMVCGSRKEPNKISGALGELGYNTSQVYKF